MFRLRYASGEEAIFRSVDELALGLRSGIIGLDTQVLDNTAHVWQPLVHHPLYAQATAIAATVTSYGDLELEGAIAAAPLRTSPSGEHRAIAANRPVYQMSSISGGELKARRQQKALLKAGIVLAAVLLVATSGFVIWRERGRPPASGPTERPLPSSPPVRRTSLPPSTVTWLSPALLASRRDEAQSLLERALADSSLRLEWNGVIALERLRSPDSLRLELDRLQRWRRLADNYRNTSFEMLRSYQDTANAQVRIDQWSLLDANDWKSRVSFVEGPADAIRVDSLSVGLRKMYELLLAESGKYQLEPAGAVFSGHRARVEYQRLSDILRRLGPSPVNARERVSLPLVLMREALEGPGLPPLAPEP